MHHSFTSQSIHYSRIYCSNIRENPHTSKKEIQHVQRPVPPRLVHRRKASRFMWTCSADPENLLKRSVTIDWVLLSSSAFVSVAQLPCPSVCLSVRLPADQSSRGFSFLRPYLIILVRSAPSSASAPRFRYLLPYNSFFLSTARRNDCERN